MPDDCVKPEYVNLVARHVREIAEIKIEHVRELNEQKVASTEKALVLAAESQKWRMGFMLSAAGFVVSVIGLVMLFLKR